MKKNVTHTSVKENNEVKSATVMCLCKANDDAKHFIVESKHKIYRQHYKSTAVTSRVATVEREREKSEARPNAISYGTFIWRK